LYITGFAFNRQPTAQPMLSGTGEAGATITFTDTVSGVSTVLGSTTVDSGGVWSYQATSITSGSHSITARQTDMAGNLSSASSAYTFTVDTTLMGLPALASASDSGTLRDAITNQTAPAFTGVAVTKGGTVQVYDGTTLLGSTTSDANTGVWTFTPANSLSSGSHTITAKDVSANTTSNPLVLTIDTTAAAPTITAPTASSNAAPTISPFVLPTEGDPSLVNPGSALPTLSLPPLQLDGR
jgi:hypothetical protein